MHAKCKRASAYILYVGSRTTCAVRDISMRREGMRVVGARGEFYALGGWCWAPLADNLIL